MFILYALAAGIAVGLAVGGSLSRLGKLQFRWGGLVLAGMAVQIALFSPVVSERIGGLGVMIYVGSTATVLLAVAANWRIAGVPVVVAGAAANLAAIFANGGYMPADPGALAATGRHFDATYSNSSLVAHAALAPLTDIFALPAWLPGTNVFSVGDVLIGAGVAWAIVAAMRFDPRVSRTGSLRIDGTSLPSLQTAAGSRAGAAQPGAQGRPRLMGTAGVVNDDDLERAIAQMLGRVQVPDNPSPSWPGPRLPVIALEARCVRTTGPTADVRWYEWVLEEA